MSKKIRVKPGKGQSAMGMAAGIVFCLIGLFVVIPTFGLFGVFWTAMAVIITVTNGINAFSDKGVSSHEIIIENEERQEMKSESAWMLPGPCMRREPLRGRSTRRRERKSWKGCDRFGG